MSSPGLEDQPGRGREPIEPAPGASGGSRPGRRSFSLAGKVTAGFVVLLVLVAALATAATLLPIDRWSVFLLVLLAGVPFGAWFIHRLMKPFRTVLQGLADGIASFRDRDFSTRLAYRRDDELGDLVRLYNSVGETLADERRELQQREMLLASALDRSPAAILLVSPLNRIIYSNREARHLLMGNGKPEGMLFDELLAGCPPEMSEILASRSEGLFSLPGGGDAETFHVSHRFFSLSRRRHRLVVLRRITGELGRQEAETWKRVIRVISHELNNALAPVSSLVHSARLLAADPERGDQAEEVFGTIRERLDHLNQFIDGYARFARLPRPRKKEVAWGEFVGSLAELTRLEIIGHLPTAPGWFDPAQMQQVVVNLVKNAVEAANGQPDEKPEVKMRIDSSAETGTILQVIDRGRGMDEETMRKALLPFYSTKKTGTGLGLALCREIMEAHDGKLSLENNPEGGLTVTCWLPTKGS